MNTPPQTRFFASYSGVKLPLNLVNPLESTEHRNTFFRAHYNANEQLVLCEKVVYGEVEISHCYQYYPNGSLKSAEITDEDQVVQVINFSDDGERI
ncbi:hypothetical protein D5085_00295 [Ectothiorhodospiraceae bacterium BW-2]|nr:hypothetical protein D5085_00295 [Ectothiorhodospiraceae bacterium BW-2]